ncbi:MAG: alpha/beta hydrolase, partial [Lentisphaerae bacterium]|nr:alpha/beta hydrolase [Lentisphaerota bacterium]
YSIAQMADDTLGLMDQLKLNDAFVMGHSMGSAIAQALAVRCPDRVSRLVLCNPLIRFRAMAAHTFRTNARLIRAGVPEHLIFRVIMPWLFSNAFFEDPARTAALEAAVEAHPTAQPLHAFERQLAALEEFDARPLLPKIAACALVIAGQADIMTPPEEAREAAGLIPNARYTTLPAGHLGLSECPEEFCDAVRGFLE